jgi:hypothetical protein
MTQHWSPNLFRSCYVSETAYPRPPRTAFRGAPCRRDSQLSNFIRQTEALLPHSICRVVGLSYSSREPAKRACAPYMVNESLLNC